MKKTLLIAGIAVIIAVLVITLYGRQDEVVVPIDTTPTPALTGNVIAVTPQVARAAVGDEVKVDIVSREVQDVSGVQISVAYDNQVLQFVKVDEGTFLNGNGQEQTYMMNVLDTKTPGLVKDFALVRLGDGGTSGSGVIGTFTFRAIQPGNAQVAISDITIANGKAQPITVQTESGRITIG